jgi:hypothetical protein
METDETVPLCKFHCIKFFFWSWTNGNEEEEEVYS